jgi:hypothetical protein
MWPDTFLTLKYDQSVVDTVNVGMVVRSLAEEEPDLDEATAAAESCKACAHRPPTKLMRAVFVHLEVLFVRLDRPSGYGSDLNKDETRNTR